MSRSRTLVRAVLAGTLALAPTLALAHGNAWINPDDEDLLDSILGVEAFMPEDNLCEGILENPFGGDPGWVRVGGSSNPDTPFVEIHGQVLPSLALKGNPYVAHTRQDAAGRLHAVPSGSTSRLTRRTNALGLATIPGLAAGDRAHVVVTTGAGPGEEIELAIPAPGDDVGALIRLELRGAPAAPPRASTNDSPAAVPTRG